jgi:hypothetical protein
VLSATYWPSPRARPGETISIQFLGDKKPEGGWKKKTQVNGTVKTCKNE